MLALRPFFLLTLWASPVFSPPQTLLTFFFAAGVSHLFLVPRFSLFNRSVVEYLRVWMFALVAHSWCPQSGGEVREALGGPTALSLGAAWPAVRGCGSFLVWRQSVSFSSLLLLLVVLLKEMSSPSLIRAVSLHFTVCRKIIFVRIILVNARHSVKVIRGKWWLLFFMKMNSYRKKVIFPLFPNPSILIICIWVRTIYLSPLEFSYCTECRT